MKLTPGARVYAFEPHPKTFARLRQEAVEHGYIALNVGCGDRRGSLSLYDHAGDDGSPHASPYREVIEAFHRGCAVEHRVELIVLDEFIAEHGISRLNLIKIDTEGYELKVLEGLRQAIVRDMIDAIQFEFNSMNIIGRCFLRDFFEILRQYRFYRMLPGGVVPLGEYSPVLCEIFAFQNVVAIRNGCGLRL
jgi:FkbM family methyltransferase